MKQIIGIVVFLFATTSFAGNIKGHVETVTTYTNYIGVNCDGSSYEDVIVFKLKEDDTNDYFFKRGDHVLSLLLTAQSTGKEVVVSKTSAISSCSGKIKPYM